MTTIRRIYAREVLDSRGNPTVEVEVLADDQSLGRAIVPSGASTGTAEACELRDGDPSRYDGQGVRLAVQNVNQRIAPALLGSDPQQQAAIDARLLELDGTAEKRVLGANAVLAVSLAVAHAAAQAARLPLYRYIHGLMQQLAVTSQPLPPPQLPLPMANMISGGLHAGGNLDIQDVMIMPVGADSYAVGLEWIVRVYRRLGELLCAAGFEGRLVGDEGGYGPRLAGNRQAVEFVMRAVEAAGLVPGRDITLALDVAASHFYRSGRYHLQADQRAELSSDEMVEYLARWVGDFPIASIEDGLAEEDWDGWRHLYQRLGQRVQLVGDDLFATSVKRVQKGIRWQAANSLLVKANQIGTLSETLQTMHTARAAGYSLVVSARSGETEDTTIADLAVGAVAEQIKIGSIVRSERLAKYNQLLRIEEQIGAAAAD